MSNNLNQLGLKYQTDKATYHNYLDFYESHLGFLTNTAKRILEIGVKDGASIRMWRDWFPENVIIEGWDINESPYIPNTKLKIVDQTNKEQIYSNISGIYDLVLDDGLHSQISIELSFAVLFPFCKFYVIEDLHAPYCYPQLKMSDRATLELLKYFCNTGKWESEYCNNSEKQYIEQFARVKEIFVRGDDNSPLSSSAIIENRYYS